MVKRNSTVNLFMHWPSVSGRYTRVRYLCTIFDATGGNLHFLTKHNAMALLTTLHIYSEYIL